MDKILISLVFCALLTAICSAQEPSPESMYSSGVTANTSAPVTPDLTKETDSKVLTNASNSEAPLLQVISKGFGYSASNDRIISMAFVLENTNKKSAVKNTRYQAALYDPKGKVLDIRSDNIHIVAPGGRVGITCTATIPEDAVADRLDIQLSRGLAVDPETESNPLTSSRITFYPHPYAPKVTGFINNSLKKVVESVDVMAIAYDEADNIIGGGKSFLEFVPAGGYTGVEVLMDVKKEPQKIELYPLLLDYTKFTDPEPELKVEKAGFVQKLYEFNAMFVVKNPSTNLTFDSVSCQIIVFDNAGRILGATSSASGSALFPGEQRGVTEYVSIPDRTIASRIEMKTLPLWISKQNLSSNPLRAEKIDFISDSLNPKVTGIINSTWPKELQNVGVTAIAYDQNDHIIGGGNGNLAFIPALGRAPVEISLHLSGETKKVELFPYASQMLDES